MKKILFVIPTLKGGGAEKVLIDLLGQMVDQEYELSLLVLFAEGEYFEELPPSIRVRSIFHKQVPGNIHLMKLFSPKLLYRLFIRESYDLIVSFLEGPTTRIVSGCPDQQTVLVNWVHNEFHKMKDLASPYRNSRELQSVYARFTQTIFVSDTAKAAFNQLVSLPETRQQTLYNPLDIEKIKSGLAISFDQLKPYVYTLISIGRFSEQKGFDRLLRILARLVHVDQLPVGLILLGKGELKQDYLGLIDELRLQQHVQLLGFQKNPYVYLRQADLFVCSSYYEGYSTAVTESLLVGTPVITTDCSGMAELLDDGRAGIITANNEEALYTGLKRLLIDQRGLVHYQKMARQRGRELAHADNSGKILNLFKELTQDDQTRLFDHGTCK